MCIFAFKFPKMGVLAPHFVFLDKNFRTRRKLSDNFPKAQNLGAVASDPMRRRHYGRPHNMSALSQHIFVVCLHICCCVNSLMTCGSLCMSGSRLPRTIFRSLLLASALERSKTSMNYASVINSLYLIHFSTAGNITSSHYFSQVNIF